MPILYTAQMRKTVRQQKKRRNATRAYGPRSCVSTRVIVYKIGVSILYLWPGAFLVPFPPKRIVHLLITKIHTLFYYLRMFLV